MITTVFIDIDNTLLDFDVCATYAMSKGLEKYGKHYENGLFECFKKSTTIYGEESRTVRSRKTA